MLICDFVISTACTLVGVDGGVVSGVSGGTYVQDCVVCGVPPVQLVGDDVNTVLDCVLSGWHASHIEYVNDVQVGGGGEDVMV